MGSSSYHKNTQNTNQQCFKWAILTKHIDEYRNQTMFIDEEHLYDFSDLKFPTPLQI
jgi:hypothetical protein